jgi:hypothetical protein
MGFYRLGLSLTLAVGLTGACKSETGPGLRLRLAGLPLTSGCLQASSKQPIDASALLQNGSVRVSAVQRTADGQRLICEATATVPSESLNLDLGEGDRATIDYYAEFFDGAGNRVASGSLLASSAEQAASGETPTLHMFAANTWSCPPSRLAKARAFHSATVLPNGEVLLLGGIDAVNVATFGADVFGLVSSAEVYDPRRAAFVALTVSAGVLAPRALHSAAVLSASGNTTRLVVYGGITAQEGNPALFLPDSPTQLRLMPGGTAQPAGAQLLDYDSVQHTLTVASLDVGTHRTAFAGGAELPGGGLVVVGGATFSPVPFMRSNPATLSPVPEAGALFLPGGDAAMAPTSAFAVGSGSPPWLLGPSVTALSSSTALVLGAKQPPDAMIKMQAQGLSGLPTSVQYPAATPVDGPSTVYHTATRLGPPLGKTPPVGSAQILVTGGFEQDTLAPYSTRQPPSAATAVRLYTVADPTGSVSSISHQAITPYMPTGTCGTADGHYRPAGFEAAAATISGNQVLITGGTPTVPPTGCADCEPTEMGANKLLCVLRQASLYNATTQTFTALPGLPLGRMGHQQTRLTDGSILISGGLVRPAAPESTQATAEAEIYNPIGTSMAGVDVNDPLGAMRAGAAACAKL